MKSCVASIVLFGWIGMNAGLAPAARAASTADIAWDACAGDGGASARAFACTNNTLVNKLYVSYTPGQDVPAFDTAEIWLNVYFQDGLSTVPSWWDPSACAARANFLVPSASPASPACSQAALAGASAALAAFQPGYAYCQRDLPSDPPGARPGSIAIDAVVSSTQGPASLAAGTEYGLLQLDLHSTATTGTGACAGCLYPAVIWCWSAWLVRQGSPGFVDQAGFGQQPFAIWQTSPNPYQGCMVTPARNATWGAIKSLYR